MLHACPEEGDQVGILYPVKDFFPMPAGLDKSHLAQAAQVVADGRFADAYQVCQVADVHFTLGQHGQDPHPAGIAEGAEQLRYMRGSVFIESGGWVRFCHGLTYEYMFNRLLYGISQIMSTRGNPNRVKWKRAKVLWFPSHASNLSGLTFP
jgi:hypothetical protein